MSADTLLSACAVSGLVGAAIGFLVGRVEGHRRGWRLACDLNAAVQRAHDYTGAPVISHPVEG